jgi:hypothetical protein
MSDDYTIVRYDNVKSHTMKQPKKPSAGRLRLRTNDLRRAISAMDYACSGTLHSRTRPCGKANCRCATGKDAWHGPYHEWSRRKEGRLVHSVLSPDQTALIRRGIANRRQIDRLLALWEDETAAEVLRPNELKARRIRR